MMDTIRLTPHDGDEPTTLQLKRPPFWSMGMVALVSLASIWFVDAVLALMGYDHGASNPDLWVTGFIVLLVMGLLWRRRLIRSQPLHPVLFLETYVKLPVNVNSSKTLRLNYSDILGIHLGGETPFQRIFLESKKQVIRFDQMSFVDPMGPMRVFKLLKQRIRHLPNGDHIIEAMRQREHIAGVAMKHRPWVTQIIIGLLAIIFMNQVATDGLGYLAQVAWGSNASPFIADGEYYRLLSANFLHVGLLHIGINAIALYSLGGVVERFLGWERFLLIYLVAGLGATMASATMAMIGPGSVGASGAIFGILGSLGVINWRYRTRLPLGFRQPVRWWIFILGINALLPLILPVIDITGHLGGLAVGAIATFFLLDKDDRIQPGNSPHPFVKAVSVALAGVFAIGIGTAIWRARNFNPKTEIVYAVRLGHAAMASNTTTPGWLNNLAFTIAISPHATQPHLFLARNMIDRAITQPSPPGSLIDSIMPWQSNDGDNQELPLYRDTRATIFYRQGMASEAVAEEKKVLEANIEWRTEAAQSLWQHERKVFASQLARFVVAAKNLGQLETPNTKGAQLSIVRALGERPKLQFTPPNEPTPATTYYIVVQHGAITSGLLRIEVPSSTQGMLEYHPPGELALTQDIKLWMALVSDTTTTDTDPSKTTWTYWPMVDEVSQYP